MFKTFNKQKNGLSASLASRHYMLVYIYIGKYALKFKQCEKETIIIEYQFLFEKHTNKKYFV